MGADVVVIAIFVFAALFVWVATQVINWSVHRTQVIDFTTCWGYGTARDFWREYSKRTWTCKPEWPDSLFDASSDSEIHASIVKFNGEGMVLFPLAYFAVMVKLRRLIKAQRPCRNRINWGAK